MRGSSHLPAARVHTLLSLLLINLVNSADPPYPRFPLQFECRVEKTAHLVDRSKEYPPWLGVIELKYDFLNRRASAYMKQGYDEGKTFLRRYDNKSEFMIRGPPYPECVRSYLGERMPPPVFPDPFELVGSDDIDGAACEHWVDDLGVNRVHLWMCPALPGSGGAEGLMVPRRLTDEQVVDGVEESIPLMTYDWLDLKLGPLADLEHHPSLIKRAAAGGAAAEVAADALAKATTDAEKKEAEDAAALAKANTDAQYLPLEEPQAWFDIPRPYGWRSCTRFLGGYPYLHLFHHYFRI